ncbi:hypothetical protein ACFQDN_22735 [Pseudomonas asuensis]|uniref:Uncharacterized protein n=1 Tax=Pseudomonas asuensis TaxID=1825787 RepID=A0ABQ2H585_9PSED|nr:hypothetical protein GCM10009425_49190 [Pseudomonas asuensis]
MEFVEFGTCGILTWLVSQAPNVHRHPWHPDVCQANTPIDKKEETLRLLKEQFDTDEKVQVAINEIRRIYKWTCPYQTGHQLSVKLMLLPSA